MKLLILPPVQCAALTLEEVAAGVPPSVAGEHKAPEGAVRLGIRVRAGRVAGV